MITYSTVSHDRFKRVVVLIQTSNEIVTAPPTVSRRIYLPVSYSWRLVGIATYYVR